MKKILTLVLSLFTFLMPIFSAGCFQSAEESSESQSASESDAVSSEESSSGEETVGDSFSVTLHTTDGGSLNGIEESGIYAIWTSKEGASIYQAPFNEKGVATCEEPDGEYQVTLSELPDGYTYNPNIYEVDNKNKSVVIDLYPLREFTGSSNGKDPYNPFKAEDIGAYRFTFKNASEQYYFRFSASYSGKIIFESLLDVTANEISPYFGKGANSQYFGNPEKITGGGAESSYTKNFYWACNLSESQNLIFVMGVDAREDATFPVTIDLLISKEEYEGEGYGYEVVEPPVDLPQATNPLNGTRFVLLADVAGSWNGKKIFDEKMVVFDEETGYYYRNKNYGKNLPAVADKNKRIYAVLTRDIPGYFVYVEPSGNIPNKGLSYREIQLFKNSKKNYTYFIKEYFGKVNSDGTYPVDAALKEYLNDYSVSHGLFHDLSGLGGFPEEHGYQATKGAEWLFVCGFYEYNIIIDR